MLGQKELEEKLIFGLCLRVTMQNMLRAALINLINKWLSL